MVYGLYGGAAALCLILVLAAIALPAVTARRRRGAAAAPPAARKDVPVPVRRRIACAAAAVLASVLAGPVLAPGAMAATVHPARPAAYWPVTITIRTVPALPGVQFSVDGTPLTTNGAGEANYTQQHNFSSHTLRLVNTTIATPLRRYQFSRSAGQRDPNQAFRPVVGGLPMRADYTVTAGFAVRCPVKPRFTSQQGTPLDRRGASRR